MSLTLRVYSEDRTTQTDLDLYGDEPINLQLSFSEIQDITTRNSGFTKGFDLPGSKKNNGFFNHYYNVDSIGITYDVNKKYPCDIIYDGYEVLQGNLRLNSVMVKGTEKIYTVTFYNQVGDLAANINDQLLCDLDLTDLSHEWNAENIQKSWDLRYLSTPNPSGWTANGLLGGKIIYPMIHQGYTYTDDANGNTVINTDITPLFDLTQTSGTISDSATPLLMDYLKLGIQVKDLYEKVVNQAGYQIESEFFNSVHFRKFYYPQTEKKGTYGLDQLVETNYYWEVERTTDLEPLNPSAPTPVIFDTIVVDDNPFWINNQKFYFPVGGRYEHTIYYNVRSTFQGVGSQNRNEGEWALYLQRYNSSGVFQSENRLLVYQLNPFDIMVGTETVVLQIQGNVGTSATSDYFQFAVEGYHEGGVGDVIFRDLFIKQSQGPQVEVGFDVDVAQEISCNVKQIDFIQSINKWFNLVVIPKPGVDNVLIIEPYEQWVGTGEELDWTQKLDTGSSIKVEPTNKIVSTSVTFDVKESKDFYNVEYKKGNPNNFTTRIENYSTDFKSNDEKVTGIFGISQDSIVPIQKSANTLYNPTTIPIFYQTKEEEKDNGVIVTKLLAYKTIPKLIYFDKFSTGGVLWYMKDTNSNLFQISDWPQFSLYSQYPKAQSMLDDNGDYVSNLKFISWDKNDQSDLVKPEINQIPGEPYIPISETNDYTTDQYEGYYKDYLENLHNSESRLVTGKIYLTPQEINMLDFSQRIRIENSIYVINKISNYDLTKPSLATVELLKFVDDYIGIPQEFYYEFEACNPNEKNIYLYTSTQYTEDSSFNTLPLGFYVVKIDGKCYKLTGRGTKPVSGANYQPLNFEWVLNPTTNFASLKLYDDCTECEGAVTTTTTTEAPLYYRIQPCGTSFIYNVSSPFVLLTGNVVDVNISLNCDGQTQSYTCMEVLGTGTTNDFGCITTINATYSSCLQCEGPAVDECTIWTFTNSLMSGEILEIEYQDCNSQPWSETFAWGNTQQSYNRCIKAGTLNIIELPPDSTAVDSGSICI